MEISRIRYFCAVAETGHLRQAAEFLRMSPGALSKSLKQLESEIGIRLLMASGRGIRLTDEGARFFKACQPLMEEYRRLSETVSKKEAPRDPWIRVGSFEVFTTYFMGQVAQELLPGHRLRLQELTPGKIEQALLDREVDIGISYFPHAHEELEFVKIARFQLGVFGRKDKFSGVSWKELPFAVPITPIQSAVAGASGLDGWPTEKYPRRVQYEFELLESALEACRRGLAVLYGPRFIIELQNAQLKPEFRLSELPGPEGLRSANQTVYLIKRKSDLENPVFRRIARGLRTLLF